VRELIEQSELTRTKQGGLQKLPPKDLRCKDFRGADLSGEDFQGADLSDADFSYANLSGTKLNRADLTRATFIGTDLTRAKMRQVCANGAKFHGTADRPCNLTGVDLYKAELVGAEFIDAILDDADLAAVKMANALLRRVSPRNARLSRFLDRDGTWAGTRIEETDLYSFSFIQSNNLIGAMMLAELMPTLSGRMISSRVETTRFRCFQHIFEDVLICFPDGFLEWHRGWDAWYKEGKLDWGVYFFFKMETLKLFYRIWRKDQDEILLHLMEQANQCGNRLLRLNIEINLRNVLPKAA
jgi:uncharacterized protein YjbI with pentapeptide repeats